MVREVFQCHRGKVPEVLEGLRVIDEMFGQAGCTNRRIFVDFVGPMDTVVHQYEVEHLDEYFAMERGIYIAPDSPTQALVDAYNANTTAGRREIYEVIQ